MGGPPPWWSPEMADLIQRREGMPGVDKWQATYVRYKCQPEAQLTQTGWNLSTSQQYADQLAMEEHLPYLTEESLLYNGLAPTRIFIRILEAPTEFGVPVKQDRRLTPNFKVRVEVHYKNRVSFPLTLKAYIIGQQEKDTIPEWVPADFLDPDVPQKKPITELKGTICVTHHFDGQAQPPSPNSRPNGSNGRGRGLGQQNAAPNMGNLWGQDMDTAVLEQLLQTAQRGGNPAETAAALSQLGQSGGPLGGAAAQLLDSLKAGAGVTAAGGGLGNQEVEGMMHQDYEFNNVELVKPTRMNKVYMVFACSILEQDLMFVVYNIPTVGICRAEQRTKACQKLGLNIGKDRKSVV